jgi:hypothetical protein
MARRPARRGSSRRARVRPKGAGLTAGLLSALTKTIALPPFPEIAPARPACRRTGLGPALADPSKHRASGLPSIPRRYAAREKSIPETGPETSASSTQKEHKFCGTGDEPSRASLTTISEIATFYRDFDFGCVWPFWHAGSRLPGLGFA